MGGIYLIQSDDQLVEMTEQAYDSEDLLQVLLARYPSILAGDQVNPSAPRRWLLVRREFGVPASGGGGGRQWDEETFMLRLRDKRGPDEVATAQELLKWIGTNGLWIWWGQGQVDGSFGPVLNHGGIEYYLFRVWANAGAIDLGIALRPRRPFEEGPPWSGLIQRLNAIEGAHIPDTGGRGKLRLSMLKDDATLKRFLGTFDWIIAQIKAS